jgi:putative inorganic carbon (hco3(-)) transporter
MPVMRDLLITAVVFASLPFVFWRPHLGILMWVWISMMSPHRLSYGFAYDFPFALVIAVATLVGLLVTNHRRPLPLTPVSILLIAFVAWMSFTSLFAMQPANIVYDAWIRVIKTQLMVLATIMLIRGRPQIEQLIWAIVISVGFYGVKGGIWTVLHGGENRVWGPAGTYIEGNNELALALVVLLPLMYYLAQTAAKRWIRYGLWFSMGACVFSILGSHSRGALIALGAVALLLGAKAGRTILVTTVLALLIAGAVSFMPESWDVRMGTIETYQQDASAMIRLQVWQTIWNMVQHRPIVGAGFDLANPILFQLYAPDPTMPEYSPHSIYFQVLGEHGFVGLALYLALGFMVWRRSRKVALLATSETALEWVPLLMRMVQVSLIGFAVGGAFLGLLHYDLPYYLAAIVVIVEAEMRSSWSAAATAQPTGIPSPTEIRNV